MRLADVLHSHFVDHNARNALTTGYDPIVLKSTGRFFYGSTSANLR